MLLNKWIVIDSVSQADIRSSQAGICFHLSPEFKNFSELYILIQKLPLFTPFSLLLSNIHFQHSEQESNFIEKIISFFFQFPYYCMSPKPLLFSKHQILNYPKFYTELIRKSKMQGFEEILVIEIQRDFQNKSLDEFAFELNDINISLDIILKKWIIKNIDNDSLSGIHFFISATGKDKDEIFDRLLLEESRLLKTDEYKFAKSLYQKQEMVERYKQELFLKASNERNLQYYLDVQKKERKDEINWYYHQYEILPKWYKQLGHLIKVIMGKRTFRSLFDDNVKKYKD